MAAEIGQKAPDFVAQMSDGAKVEPFKLSDHLGEENIVLAFFPFAFSGVCTEEFCTFRDDLSRYSELNAKVLGISVDSPHALNAWIRHDGLKINMLSDFNKEVSPQFGAFHEELGPYKGVSKRSIFVLDKEGMIKYRWVSDVPTNLPDFEEVQKALQSLQA